MTDNNSRPRPETIAAAHGVASDAAFGAVSPPLYFSTTYEFAGYDQPRAYDYGRAGNPTRDLLADAIARLEGGALNVVGFGEWADVGLDVAVGNIVFHGVGHGSAGMAGEQRQQADEPDRPGAAHGIAQSGAGASADADLRPPQRSRRADQGRRMGRFRLHGFCFPVIEERPANEASSHRRRRVQRHDRDR